MLRTRSPLSTARNHRSNTHRFPFDLHVLSTPPAFILSQDQTLRIFADATQAYLLTPVRSATSALLRKAHSNSQVISLPNRSTSQPKARIQNNPKTTDRSAGLAYLATLQLLMCHNFVTLLHNRLPNQIPIQLICYAVWPLIPPSSAYGFPDVSAEIARKQEIKGQECSIYPNVPPLSNLDQAENSKVPCSQTRFNPGTTVPAANSLDENS